MGKKKGCDKKTFFDSFQALSPAFKLRTRGIDEVRQELDLFHKLLIIKAHLQFLLEFLQFLLNTYQFL